MNVPRRPTRVSPLDKSPTKREGLCDGEEKVAYIASSLGIAAASEYARYGERKDKTCIGRR